MSNITRNCTCIICGKPFVAKNTLAKFCSQKCNNYYWTKRRKKIEVFIPKTATCPICGKEFDSRGHNKIYCSRQCQRKNEHEERRTYYNPVVSKPIVDRTAEVKEIDRKAKYMGMSYGKYVALQQMAKERKKR